MVWWMVRKRRFYWTQIFENLVFLGVGKKNKTAFDILSPEKRWDPGVGYFNVMNIKRLIT